MNSQTGKVISWLRDDLLDFGRRIDERLSSILDSQRCRERNRRFWRIRTEGWVWQLVRGAIFRNDVCCRGDGLRERLKREGTAFKQGVGLRGTIHKKSHLARSLRTQLVENKKPYISALIPDMGPWCDIEVTLNTISRS